MWKPLHVPQDVRCPSGRLGLGTQGDRPSGPRPRAVRSSLVTHCTLSPPAAQHTQLGAPLGAGPGSMPCRGLQDPPSSRRDQGPGQLCAQDRATWCPGVRHGQLLHTHTRTRLLCCTRGTRGTRPHVSHESRASSAQAPGVWSQGTALLSLHPLGPGAAGQPSGAHRSHSSRVSTHLPDRAPPPRGLLGLPGAGVSWGQSTLAGLPPTCTRGPAPGQAFLREREVAVPRGSCRAAGLSQPSPQACLGPCPWHGGHPLTRPTLVRWWCVDPACWRASGQSWRGMAWWGLRPGLAGEGQCGLGETRPLLRSAGPAPGVAGGGRWPGLARLLAGALSPSETRGGGTLAAGLRLPSSPFCRTPPGACAASGCCWVQAAAQCREGCSELARLRVPQNRALRSRGTQGQKDHPQPQAIPLLQAQPRAHPRPGPVPSLPLSTLAWDSWGLACAACLPALLRAAQVTLGQRPPQGLRASPAGQGLPGIVVLGSASCLLPPGRAAAHRWPLSGTGHGQACCTCAHGGGPLSWGAAVSSLAGRGSSVDVDLTKPRPPGDS